ncbi:MAG: hypothetical protein JWM56_932 [Candidatus Peribacteria bacterium]|nr:hypothetical protein [Candidatus Peribacteria bacterium]
MHKKQNTYRHIEQRLCYFAGPLDWARDNIVDPAREAVNSVESFFSGMTVADSRFKRMIDKPDRITAQNLTDSQKWIAAFNTIDLTAPGTTPTPAPPFGPEQFLLSLSGPDRQAIYVEFVEKYIPAAVRAEYNDVFPGPGASIPTANKFAIMNAKKAIINTALSGMVGETVAMDDTTLSIAKKSLNTHYSPVLSAGEERQNMTQDLKDAVRFQHKINGPTRPATVATLKEDIPPSLFKGALKLGVITEERLSYLHDNLNDLSRDRELIKGKVTQSLDVMTQASKSDLAKEAKTSFVDALNKMDGYEKIILGAAVIYLLTFKKVRYAAVAGAISILGLKAFTGVNLLDVGVDLADKAKESLNAKAGSDKKASAIETAATRASTLVNFLDSHDRDGLEQSATGLGILSDVPLNELSTQFDMNNENPAKWRLQTNGSVISKRLRETAKKYNLKADYQEFFDNENNQLQISEGITYTFYLWAAKNPVNRERVQIVEDARRALPSNQGYPNLTGKARETYLELAREGRNSNLNNTQTLGSLVLEASNLNQANITNAVAPDRDLERFAVLRTEVIEESKMPDFHEYKELTVEVFGDKVRYGVVGIMAETPLPVFLAKTSRQILVHFKAWDKDATKKATDVDPFDRK